MNELNYSVLADIMGWSTSRVIDMVEKEDWCAWRKIEEKIYEYSHEKGWANQVLQQNFEAYFLNTDTPSLTSYIHSDLRTRCLALISVLDSSHA